MTLTREQLKNKKSELESLIQATQEEYAGAKGAKLNAGMALLTKMKQELISLEEQLSNQYVPFHYQDQLISPRSLFVSPLFAVKNNKTSRIEYMEKDIPVEWHGTLKYAGPELRQSDALVFAGLINKAQDYQVGAGVSFDVEDFCIQLFGHYDGHIRQRLKEHIIRLQSAVLQFSTFSVQLCLRFEHPSDKQWSVALDPELVFLFKERYTWISLNRRKSLREGLTTWLYAYISCQKILTKISIEQIRILSGSDAELRSFTNILRIALQELAENNIVSEWKISRGYLTWVKTVNSEEQNSIKMLNDDGIILAQNGVH